MSATSVQTQPSKQPEPTRTLLQRLPSWFGPWELALGVVVIITLVIASFSNSYFATGQNFSISAAGAIGLALMCIPMTWLMIAGEIDLSVASVFGLTGVIFAMAIENSVPLPLAILIGLVCGALAGLLNGFLTLRFGLPSLVVTVGTLGLFRGLAYILLESRSISKFPREFTDFAQNNIPGTNLPYTFMVFIVLGVICGVLLHRSTLGRQVYAVGSSEKVAKFSGIRVTKLKLQLFIASGTFAALAGMLYAGYVSSARANNGVGLELSVIALVLIGGVSMYGGRGSFVGVALALILVTSLTSWMNLEFVPSNVQNTAIGSLMIAAVVIPAVAAKIKERRPRPAARGNRPSQEK